METKLVENPALPAAFVNFDKMPDAARVKLPVVMALYSRSAPSIWRGVKAGTIPAPVKFGGGTDWIVGDLRRALSR